MFTPTFRIHVDVDEACWEGDASKRDLISAFKAAAVRVAVKPTPEPPFKPCSTVRLRASLLHRPLWDVSDPKAQENWKRVLIPQMREMLPKVQRDLRHISEPGAFRETDLHLLELPRFEVQVEQYVMSFACARSFEVPDGIPEALEQFRELINDGTLDPLQVERVDVPFIDVEALQEAYEAEQAALTAAAEADAAESDAAEGAEPVEGAAPEDVQAEADAEAIAEEPEAPAEDEPPAIDYSVWGVTMRDGTVLYLDFGVHEDETSDESDSLPGGESLSDAASTPDDTD